VDQSKLPTVQCHNLATCKVFELFKNPKGAQTLKSFYCERPDFARCARLTEQRKGNEVPYNLLPTGALLGK
jgi:hypothetical protein